MLFVDLARGATDFFILVDRLDLDFFPILYLCVFNLIDCSYDNNVLISSNSWSIRAKYKYSQRCMDTDRFIWEHDDQFVAFAAGNEGEWG